MGSSSCWISYRAIIAGIIQMGTSISPHLAHVTKMSWKVLGGVEVTHVGSRMTVKRLQRHFSLLCIDETVTGFG